MSGLSGGQGEARKWDWQEGQLESWYDNSSKKCEMPALKSVAGMEQREAGRVKVILLMGYGKKWLNGWDERKKVGRCEGWLPCISSPWQ